jgi:c-di-GMP-binding flagellar brake protein YcgR
MAAVTAASAPKLAEGQHVTVRHVTVGMLPGTVDRAGGGSVVVALNVKEERIGRLVGHDVAVEITSGRGIYRYSGKLSGQQEGTLTISLSGEVERIQRREFVRIPAHLEVGVRGVDEDIGGETTTVDVSGAGIQITDKWNLPLGLDVRVELKLPGEGPPLRALGRVVRVGAEEDQKGIRLDGLPRVEEDRLMRYIREREVQALRAARNA